MATSVALNMLTVAQKTDHFKQSITGYPSYLMENSPLSPSSPPRKPRKISPT